MRPGALQPARGSSLPARARTRGLEGAGELRAPPRPGGGRGRQRRAQDQGWKDRVPLGPSRGSSHAGRRISIQGLVPQDSPGALRSQREERAVAGRERRGCLPRTQRRFTPTHTHTLTPTAATAPRLTGNCSAERCCPPPGARPRAPSMRTRPDAQGPVRPRTPAINRSLAPRPSRRVGLAPPLGQAPPRGQAPPPRSPCRPRPPGPGRRDLRNCVPNGGSVGRAVVRARVRGRRRREIPRDPQQGRAPRAGRSEGDRGWEMAPTAWLSCSGDVCSQLGNVMRQGPGLGGDVATSEREQSVPLGIQTACGCAVRCLWLAVSH